MNCQGDDDGDVGDDDNNDDDLYIMVVNVCLFGDEKC